jgi:hypothetical protein
MLPYKLMDATNIIDARTALICARLYLRGGKRRLEAGFSAEGIASLYHAVLFGMRYYIASHKGCTSWVKSIDPLDAPGLFHALARAGVFDDPLTFHRLSLLVERALWQGSFGADADSILTEFEKMLSKLGILTVDKASRSVRH